MTQPYSHEEYLRALNEPIGEGDFRAESIAAAEKAELQIRREEAAEKYRAALKNQKVPDTRKEVAAALRAYEEQLASDGNASQQHLPPGLKLMPEKPPVSAPAPKADPESAAMAAKIFPQVGAGYVSPKPGPNVTPGALVQSSVGGASDGMGRSVLNLASGGGTEAVIAAQEGAGDQAKKDVTEKGLSGMTMEQRIAAFMAATGATPQQAQQFVRVNPSWVPGTRTAATGATGMDPAAQDALFVLEKGRGIQDEEALRQTQDADALKHRQMLEVQGNALKAEEAFRRDQASIQQRYDTERAEQMERLKQVQAAMDSVGKSPRTIREWLDSSGTGKKVTYGLAAALSAIGGAIGRRGNQPLQDLFNRTQASIDAKVKQEQDTYRILGEKAKLSDSVYARIRQATQDDTAALNITKAMYYDALGHMVDQIGTQYKLDMQSPQVLDFMSKLSGRYQDLIKETATRFQEQSSQTDKFNPGGVFAVGGSGGGTRSADKKQLMEDMKYYSERADKLKVPGKEKSVKFLTRAIENMVKAGVTDADKPFWEAFAAMTAGGSSGKDTFSFRDARKLVMLLPPKKQEIIQDILQSGQEQMSDEAGKALTGNELALQIAKKGGFSVNGLRKVRDQLAEARDRDLASIDTVFDPDPAGGSTVGNLYRNRVLYAQTTRPDPILNTSPYPAITPGEKKVRDSAKLE